MNLSQVERIKIEVDARQYVGGQMSKDEETQFETCMLKDPRIAQEVEITRRMHDGLRQLQLTDVLDLELPPRLALRPRVQLAAAAGFVMDLITPLLPRLAPRPRILLATAAGIVIVVAATALYYVSHVPPSTILAASAHELRDFGGASTPMLYLLAERRTLDDGLVIPKPNARGVIQLNILPTYPDVAGKYRVELRRAAATSGSKPLARVDANSADLGFVPIFLNTSELAAGRYVLTAIEPETAGRSPATTQYIFTLTETSDHRSSYRFDE